MPESRWLIALQQSRIEGEQKQMLNEGSLNLINSFLIHQIFELEEHITGTKSPAITSH